jgi:hypothetical protein
LFPNFRLPAARPRVAGFFDCNLARFLERGDWNKARPQAVYGNDNDLERASLTMRSLFILTAIAATVLATAAKAQNYPWCALYKDGAMNCGFTTFQQCLATVSGSGGFCTQNSTYQPSSATRPRNQRNSQY